MFVFGSFIRRKSYGDIDILITYEEHIDASKLKLFESSFDQKARKRYGESHIGVASEREFGALRLKHDNLTQVYP